MLTDKLRTCLRSTDDQQLKRQLALALAELPAEQLPLQDGCTQGGMIDASDLAVSVLDVQQSPGRLSARVGVFFTEVVGGCNCHDDPGRSNAYCVLEVGVDGERDTLSLRVVPD